VERPDAVLSLYHLLDPEVLANPYPLFERLRRESPVHWDPFLHAWIVTRYPDVLEVLHTYSADRTPTPEQLSAMGLTHLNPVAQVMVKQMLFMDAPAHTRLRSLAAKAFTPARVEQLRDHIRDIVNRLLDDIEPKGSMDVIADFAEPLPAIVTAELLGVPVKDWQRLKAWSANFAEMLGNFQHNPEHAPIMRQTVEEMTTYFREAVREIAVHPREGLISSLITAEIDGDRLTEEEVIANSIVTMVGGQETTTNLIGNGMLALLRHPAELAKLNADLSLIPSAVEEMLRFESPSQHTARLAPSDRELGGKQIQKRQAVIAIMAAANRDPERFPDPDRFDITRTDNRHLAFGYAAHFCFGAPLARAEGQIAFERMLSRFRNLRLEPQNQNIVWRTNLGLRGLTALKVSFDSTKSNSGSGNGNRAENAKAPVVIQAQPTTSAVSEDAAARNSRLEQYLKQRIQPTGVAKRGTSGPAPLSFPQQQIWLHAQIAPEVPIYNEPVTIYRDGPLDLAILQKCFAEIFRRHEAWRTTFDVVHGEPVQIVNPVPTVALPVLDLRHLPEERRDAAALDAATEDARRPFDLKQCPLLRVLVTRLADEKYRLYITLHHVIFDGLSIYRVFLPELATLYAAYSEGKSSPLPELPIQYADFAQWQRDYLRNEVLAKHLDYWREKLSGDLPILELPADYSRPAVQTFRGAIQAQHLSKDLSERLRALSKQENSTLFITLLAAFKTLLHRYTGQDDIVIGTVAGARKRSEFENLLGCFQNPVVLRTEFAGDPSFQQILGRVRETTLGALQNDEVPFELVVKELHTERDLSRNPLVQVAFTLVPQVATATPGWSAGQWDVETGAAKFDLYLEMEDGPGGLVARFMYRTDLFRPETIARLRANFTTLLESITAHPEQSLATLPLLTVGERTQLLVEWNSTQVEYPAGLLHDLVTRAARRSPFLVALACGTENLTYQELDRRSDRLAQILRQSGVGPEIAVGLYFERSIEMIVGILGVLKAGGVCLPLDPAYPADRLAFMLSETQAPVLLTQSRLQSQLPPHHATVLCIDCDLAALQNSQPLPASATPDSTAYLIYTSGSTGQPKGVRVTHRGLVNSTLARTTYYSEAPSAFLLLSSFAFDSSLAGIFWTLAAGGKLVLPPEPARWELNSLTGLIDRHKVSHLLCVPSLYQTTLEIATSRQLESLRAVIVAGEACPVDLIEQHLERAPQAALYNEYGPTEATVWSSVYRCEARGDAKSNAGRVPIGRPIANTQLYVLDSRMQVVPIGVRGELYIGGAGVTTGYLNRPELNAAKFLPNPFAANSSPVIYRTGDQVRYLPDGNLEWLGRADGQIKLRGFRIELGEIESAISAHDAVRRCFVQIREDQPGNPQLVAYIVSRAAEPAPEDLRQYLAQRLPAHAVPSAFVFLESLPELPNGKINARRLPSPAASTEVKSGPLSPRTPVEEVIAGIWAQVLQREHINVREDFFSLGGHSLLAAKVVARIAQSFGIELSLRSIFERPTVEGLAALIETSRSDRSASLTLPLGPVSRDADPPLSFAQQRLWFLDQLEPGNPLYNVPCAIRIAGLLNISALERSLNEIIRRHEILRTRFTTSGGQPVQVIAPSLTIPLPVTDLAHLPPMEREARAVRLASEEAERSFNLGAGPLLRTNLLRLAADQHILLLNIHHIASDETSREIVVRELVALYEAFSQGKPSPLAELKTQYADYAAWQRGWLQHGSLAPEIAHWRERLQGAPAVLELPTDRPRPAAQSFRGANESLDLDPAIAAALKTLSQREGTTLFMTLLAAFQALLSRYTGQEDIVVGSPFTNRQRPEVEGLIGFFVNTVPLRTSLSGDPTFYQLLQRVKATALDAYDHRELPFEKLVEELRPERNLSYNPLFQILFAVQGSPAPVEHVAGITLHLQDVDTGTAKFDLTCTVIPKDKEREEDKDGGFTTSFEYNTDLFEPQTIRRMMDSFHSILEAIARKPEQRLSELPLLSQKERQRVLVEWNATHVDYPREKCVHQLVEGQARVEPDAVAVLHEHDKLTYGDLNERANQLAHFLRQRGVGPDVPVGICLDNSLELTIALLAVLKAGGACLPLDPAYPKERLQLMLEDSHAPILLAREGLLPELSSTHAQRICMLSIADALARESRQNPEQHVTPANLAYVIYTSGSTGKPKGVMLTHGGLVNYIGAVTKLYGLRSSDRLLQFSSISFDIAIEEIFPTWSVGATLVLRSSNFSLAGNDFLRFARQQKLTVLSVATAYWHELVHELSESGAEPPESLRLLVVGGEKAQIQALEAWRKIVGNRVRWINTYGPTETSVIATSYEPPSSGTLPSPLPIGRPIGNVKIHILDRNLQPVPVGIPGEVHIGGPGVARGYLNHPELTAEKFVRDPFSSQSEARLYKTGDLARYLDDGEIEFVGRRDFQVKIRGFRVELGEIEAALAKHAAVREALVLAREEGLNNKRLVGYVIPAAGATPDAAELRKFLKRQLPEYMVPPDFVLLHEFPLTPNGKVDRKALPAPEPSAAADHVAAANPVEAQLVAMWEEILARKPISVRDNFFDLGGHSLLAVRLMRRIEQSFKRKLPLTTLFEAPTIEQFAALLQQEQWTPSQASLVAIQPEGDRAPFFCIHGLGGTVLRFNALARHLGTERPFYGVQAQGLEGDRAFHTTVEEMAAFYIKEIRVRQPEGPYYIGGYSLGGLIAFEMSRQLQAEGQEVGLLALLDTYPGKPKSNKMLLSSLMALPRREQLSYIAQRAKRIRRGIKRRFEALFLPRPLKEVRRVFASAEEVYKPQVYFGSATWFRATEKGLRGVDNPTDDWSKWVTGGVEVHDIEGDHGSILKAPDVRLLAESLRTCLNKAEDEHAEANELEAQIS
jgi:amino acid adenylation domain-containing protein